MKYTKEDMIKAFAVHPTAYLSDEEEREAAEEWLRGFDRMKRFEKNIEARIELAKDNNKMEKLTLGKWGLQCSAESVKGIQCPEKVTHTVHGDNLCEKCYGNWIEYKKTKE